MKRRISQFINYVKEAFVWPVHLVGLGTATVLTAATTILLPSMGVMDRPPMELFMMLAGAEMLYLSVMSKNARFIRAINSKYGKEIDAFNKTRLITKYYNSLSGKSQQHFDTLYAKLVEIRKHYANIHKNFPDLINSFLDKINGIQLSYIRLLTMRDKYPEYVKRENPSEIKKKIAAIEADMEGNSTKIREIKRKRIRLLEKRLTAFDKSADNQKKVNAQLKTIEEMVVYMREQALSMTTTDREDELVDNLLMETEQMTDTLTDLEAILSGDFDIGGYDLDVEEQKMDLDEISIP